MTETKHFPTAAVLTVVTGRLLGDIGMVYEILCWMTDESVYTHQLPRVGGEAKTAVLAMHPELAGVDAESQQVDEHNWQDWLATWVARYGETIPVPKLSRDEHERIDPLSELAEKVHPDRIVVVSP